MNEITFLSIYEFLTFLFLLHSIPRYILSTTAYLQQRIKEKEKNARLQVGLSVCTEILKYYAFQIYTFTQCMGVDVSR